MFLCTSYSTGIPTKSGEVTDGIFVFHFQFLMDYNLYGMNLLRASAAKFRNPVRLVDGDGMWIKNLELHEVNFFISNNWQPHLS